MVDNTVQGGLDTIATDELLTINGASAVAVPPVKVQRVKVGHGADSDFNDVTAVKGLPVAPAFLDVPLVAGSTTFTTAVNGTAIDTLGYAWASVQMSAGYTGMTALTCQASNDGIAWFNTALTSLGSTSSGITTAMGTGASLFHFPIPARYLRFVPVGTGSGLVLTLNVRLMSVPSLMPSIGANANLTVIGGNAAPAISTATLSIGTGTQNAFQFRATGSADQAALTTALAAVAGQMPYVTGIHVAVWGASATPRQARVIAAAAALIEQNVICPGNDSKSRMFRNPWKPMSSVNNILQYSLVSVGTAAGNWELVIEGYYQTS